MDAYIILLHGRIHEEEGRVRMINALCATPLPPEATSPVILMVSGGSDSTALLMRAATDVIDLFDGAEPQHIDPARLHVLHINHGLRGANADGDEAFVQELCERLGIAYTIRHIDIGRLIQEGANMESVAREARYAAAWDLAGELCAQASVPLESARIAVAHTADDRAETCLMRIMCGAGISGITGLRRSRGIVVRPLLDETRRELRDYLTVHHIGWREDATNADDVALRSYVRNHVMPLFVERNPAFSHTLSTTLDLLADEDEFVDHAATDMRERLCLPSRPATVALNAERLAECEPALACRVLREELYDLLGADTYYDARFEARHIEALLDLVRAGKGSCTLPCSVDARIDHGALVISLPPVDNDSADVRCGPPDALLAVPGTLMWGDVTLQARLLPIPKGENACVWARTYAAERAMQGDREDRDFVLADAQVLGVADGGALSVGSVRTGERMYPFGMKGSKSIAELFSDVGIPLRDRPWVPVIRSAYTSDADLYLTQTDMSIPLSCVWIGGIRLDARAAYRPNSSMLVELNFIHNFDHAASCTS